MAHTKIFLNFNIEEDYKYPVFLISLLLFLFVPSFFSGSLNVLMSNILFIVFILCSLLLIQTKKKFKRRVTYLIGIVGLVSEIYERMINPVNDYLQSVFLILLFLYFIIIAHELITQVINSQNITLNVIFGAFTGYIMLGIIGFFIFKMIYILNPESFALSGNVSSELIYYSFITLTTIGYGDILPLSESARNFAVIVGLTGQFYIGIIMAIIIGKFLQGSN